MGRISQDERRYAQLLKLYPAAYRRRFEAGMRQTFRDLYRDQPRHGAPFWTGVTFDLVAGAAREHISIIRSLDMKNLNSVSASTGALYAGIILMLPSSLFLAVGTGLQIMPPHHNLGQELHLPLHLVQVGLAVLPLLALIINLGALLMRWDSGRQSLFSLAFMKRYVLTLALMLVAAGWLAVLFGHDTAGCAAQHLTQLQWQAFRHCAATH